MPSFPLPPGVPLGLGWFVLWMSIHGVFIFILRLLEGHRGHLEENIKRESEGQLPSLNEHLWRLVNESSGDPYDGPLGSVDDLSRLLDRVRNVSKPIIKYGRWRRHTAFGYLACSIAVLAAIVCGGIFLADSPTHEWASFIGIVAFSAFTLWSAWHLANALVFFSLIVRMSDED